MDLSTRYLGMTLKNPIVASASPLSRDLDGIRQMEDAGAAAVVLFSLFEEQIATESRLLDLYLDYGAESHYEAPSYFPEAADYHVGPDEYLKLIARAKRAVNIPIIASLNGVTSGGWTRYAGLMEAAGADALELNMYQIPTDPMVSSAAVEQGYLDTLNEVLRTVEIPVAVKLSPYFTSTAHMAGRLAQAGARGLVLFNRFYQPDFDLERLDVVPNLVFSRSHDLLLPLHWTAILHGRVPVDLAITSGVHTHKDVLKALMAGASVTQMASELLNHGTGRIGEILNEMTAWMQEFEYESVAQMQGSMSQRHVSDPTAFERGNYMRVLQSYRPDPASRLM
jgi:dihydroorotate dehydrogenase (fumarate)